MDGYWRAPTLTRNALRDDVVLGETVYRSGDLVYRDERGNYVYVDRIDRVVKRSGVRISLVELSESLSKLGDITAAACLSFDQDGELGIAAFVVTDIELSSIDLRRAALRLIPENMLPDRFVFVDEMPLDKSNQMDEARLLSAAGLRPYHPGSA
jgi:acyl-coenzyme A synthetase/AMP-(fatty) acid ligase